MKRWHLSLLLGGLAVTAALTAPLVPTFRPATSAPLAAGTLQLTAGLDRPAVLAGEPRDRRLVVEVTAVAAAAIGRAPRDVVVVLDTSGSMSGAKLDQARGAIRALRDALYATEDFAVVIFNDTARTAVPPDARDEEVDALLAEIHDFGGTNLYAGLELAALHLREMRTGHEAGHIVVVSDGEANVGVIDDAAFESFAADLRNVGGTVSAVGLAPNADIELLERLASAGGGVSSVVAGAEDLLYELPAVHTGQSSVVARELSVDIVDTRGVEVVGWLNPATRTRARLVDDATFVADVKIDPAFAPSQIAVELRYTDGQGVRRQQTTQIPLRVVSTSGDVARSLDGPRTVTASRHAIADRLLRGIDEGADTAKLALTLAADLRFVAQRTGLSEPAHDADALLDGLRPGHRQDPARATEMAVPTAEELALDLVE